MGKLDGKVAIVTGGARGLGRAYALRLAALGARVAIADLDLRSYRDFEAEAAEMTGESTVHEIEAGGGEAMGFEFDIGDRDEMFAMAGSIRQRWGRIDILIANAGGGRGTREETTASAIDPHLLELVTRMNLFGTIHSCSAVAETMKEQRSGRIVTVASYAALVANIGGTYAHYGANKAAIAHYTRYLAQELGPYGINCNCIAPGYIETGRIAQLVGITERGQDPGWAGLALRRPGTAEDCAKVVEFLTTDLSDYVTGALIPVDGGWSVAGGTE